MNSAVKHLPKNSFYTKQLAEGCIHCEKGSKMVLVVTGLCNSHCFYCPLSEKKKGKNVIYANELMVKKEKDILEEGELMEADGTGITGGDPLVVAETSAHIIHLLKKYFGEKHHIHLYTATFDTKKIELVKNAGLDELRVHPHPTTWKKIERSALKTIVKNTEIPMGVEIPLIPHLKDETRQLLIEIDSYGIDFINLNELEFSETNITALKQYGYETKNDVSNAVKGCDEMAKEMVALALNTPLHYCSSSFKDAIQLRRRIMRRARNVVKPYEMITEDGTLLIGVILAGREKIHEIREMFQINEALLQWNSEKKRIETSPFILEEIAQKVPYPCYMVEEYPTADKLEVERIPLN
jgi:pyruvate formate-lyase activating enzyme-like uncharacterized protein